MISVKGKEFPFIKTNGWNVSDSGVYKVNTDEKKILASCIPVVPTAIYENIDTNVEKIELSFYKMRKWRSVIVPRSQVASNTSIIKLADSGLEVTSDNAKNLVRYIGDVVSNSLDDIPHRPSKSVMGWVDDLFVPYTDEIAFDGDESYGQLYKSLKTKGNLEDWCEFMKPLRSKIELRLAMATSFASPLIELIGANPFVTHIWGKTGTAKTVALLIAMSIWGDPAMGKLTRTMNMTQNSMLSTAAFLKNLPFAGDELQTIKSRWSNYDNLIMCITEGIDRGRMSFDKVNETKSWKCSFLFTGEEPCTKQASGGGVKNRVIEIECEGKLVDNGTLVANFARSHYGNAGVKFIESIKDYDIQEMYQEYMTSILEKVGTTDKQAGAMAIMMLADKISSDLFWDGEEPITIDMVSKYLHSDDEVDVSERAYQYIVDVIAQNGTKFVSSDASDYKGEIWGKRISPDRVWFINVPMKKCLEDAGFDFDAVKRKWNDAGYLVMDKGNYRHKKRIGESICSCTVINLPDETEALPKSEELPF